MGDIHLKLRAVGDRLPIKARLGKLLKYALRCCDLRCVEMSVVDEETAKNQPVANPPGDASCR